MERVVGIDLGTTHASVAVVQDGVFTLLPDDAGHVLTPAAVHFPAEGGEPTVGTEARRRRLADPPRTIHLVGRLLGRDFSDPSIPRLQRMVAFPIAASPSGKVCVRVGDGVFSSSEIAAEILRSFKARADAHAGEPVRKAVLVVPASSTDPQRLALRMAAQMAGLDPVRVINRPTAVAVMRVSTVPDRRRVAVCCLGGGDFDVSILEISRNAVAVLSTAGDSSLGVDLLDEHLFDLLRRRFKERHGVDLADDVVAAQRLWGAADSAKVHLSENQTVEVRLREMAYAAGSPVDLAEEVTRKDLAAGAPELLRRIQMHCDEAMVAAGVSVGDIEEVLLSGGGSRTPLVVEAMARYFQQTPSTALQDDGTAAMGAAVYGTALGSRAAGAREPPRIMVQDVQAQAVLVEAGDTRDRVLPRNAPLPAAARRIITTRAPDQDHVSLRFFQGDGVSPTRVGDVVVEGLKPGPRGKVRLDAVLEVDTDGIITATFTDQDSGLRTATPVRVGAESLEQDVVLLRMQRGEVRA